VMPTAVSPAAVIVRMPVMPVVRMVVAATVVMLVPAMAPFVADVGRLHNVWRLRGLSGHIGRQRGRRRDRECNAAKRGETDKCRNDFHDVHLLTSVGGGLREFGSAHYRGLMPMNVRELLAMNPFADAMRASHRCACQFVINRIRTGLSSRSTNHCSDDGGFDEDDVTVAIARSGLVVRTHPQPSARRQPEADAFRRQGRRSRRTR